MQRPTSWIRRTALAATIAGTALAAAAVPATAASGGRQAVRDPLAGQAAEALDALRFLRLVESGAVPASIEAVDAARTTYLTEAGEVAADVSARAGGAPADYLAAWTAASDHRMIAVYTGLAQVGDPYRRRSSGPDAFDCSGLTGYAWSAAGVELPRNSTAQIRTVAPTDPSALEPGDLVWRPGHVMLYLGADDAVVHAPQSGRNVEVRSWGRTARFGDVLP